MEHNQNGEKIEDHQKKKVSGQEVVVASSLLRETETVREVILLCERHIFH